MLFDRFSLQRLKMPPKKILWIIAIVVILLIIIFAVLRVGLDGQGEDSWIKNSRGVWIKHGNP